MSALVRSESVTLLSAIESTLGTQPTTGWRQQQPNPDGLQDFYPKVKKVARAPLSKNRQNEKGDIVDLDAVPKFVHDLNKDFLDYFGAGIFVSLEKFNGGTGSGRFAVTQATVGGAVALTAVAAGAYTVASGGALPQGLLMYGRNFANAANNGLVVVGASSTGTSIVCATAVLEASPPTNAQLEVCGFQGVASDITIDASGNLNATALNFTTLGLQVGQWIWIGGGTAASPGAFGFATAADRGFAKITAIAAGKLTLARRTQTFAADSGTGKTIQFFFGSYLRNVAIDNADYLETTYQFELALPGIDTAAATGYVYAQGCLPKSLELNAPLTDKIVATLTMSGLTFLDESTSRATGASSFIPPIAEAAINTTTEEPRIRLANQVDESIVCQDISSWKLSFDNNAAPQKQQGTLGGIRQIVGKALANVDMEAFLVQPDALHRIRDNNTVMWDACLRNNDGGCVLDIPSATVEDGTEKFPANGPVTIALKIMGFRDTTYNVTLGLTKFPFLPAN